MPAGCVACVLDTAAGSNQRALNVTPVFCFAVLDLLRQSRSHWDCIELISLFHKQPQLPHIGAELFRGCFFFAELRYSIILPHVFPGALEAYGGSQIDMYGNTSLVNNGAYDYGGDCVPVDVE